MVHYRHRYHAGNFADVFKHLLLVGLLGALNRKDKPWCFVDTHAGAGCYDLGDAAASATEEWRGGIGRIADEQAAPAIAETYLGLVRAANRSGELRTYPGSPQIALALARPGDRVIACESVDEVAETLKQNLRGDARVAIHRRNGYEAAALLPPAEKRGLVLIDPPFERGDELDAIAELLNKAAARFAGGIYAAWYPVKNAHAAARFVRRVPRETARAALNFTFDNGAPAAGNLHACGLLVVNPPFGFGESAHTALAWLAPLLAQGPTAAFSIAESGPD